MKPFLLCSVALCTLIASDLAGAAGSTPDEILARIDAVEKQNVLLREEVAVLRKLMRESGQNQKILPPKKSSALAKVTPPGTSEPFSSNRSALKHGDVYAAAQSPSPLQSTNWSGFYVGGLIGGRWDNSAWTTNSVRRPVGATGYATAVPVTDRSSVTFFERGLRAGGYIGANWQFARQWVIGLEGDWTWSHSTGNLAGFPGVNNGTNYISPILDNGSVTLGWDASVRGRLGLLINPATMVYGTAGASWQHVNLVASCGWWTSNSTSYSALCSPFSLPMSTIISDGSSKVLPGWTIGAGIETEIFGGWFGRAEYRYAAYAPLNHVFFPTLAREGHLDTTVAIQTHSATIGIGYKFQ